MTISQEGAIQAIEKKTLKGHTCKNTSLWLERDVNPRPSDFKSSNHSASLPEYSYVIKRDSTEKLVTIVLNKTLIFSRECTLT